MAISGEAANGGQGALRRIVVVPSRRRPPPRPARRRRARGRPAPSAAPASPRRKREGDGATPAGRIAPRRRPLSRRPRSAAADRLPVEPIRPRSRLVRRSRRPQLQPPGPPALSARATSACGATTTSTTCVVVLDYNLAQPAPRRRQRHLPASRRGGIRPDGGMRRGEPGDDATYSVPLGTRDRARHRLAQSTAPSGRACI